MFCTHDLGGCITVDTQWYTWKTSREKNSVLLYLSQSLLKILPLCGHVLKRKNWHECVAFQSVGVWAVDWQRR